MYTLDEILLDVDDLGADDESCHLGDATTRLSVCGAKGGRHRGETQSSFTEPPSTCPLCGRPTCPTCLAIWRSYQRSGGWEGQ